MNYIIQKNNLYKKPILILLSLFSIYILGVYLRLHFYQNLFAGFVPFTAESASHYYYAKMIAESKKVPAIDYNIQYPEGLKVFGYTCIFMEYVVGYLYRYLPLKVDFHQFIRYFIPIFYCSSLFAVYLCVLQLTNNNLISILSSLLFIISYDSVGRSCGFEFLSENFTLPFIFFHFYFFIKSHRREQPLSNLFLLSTSAGIFLFISLASWKISQFYFLVITIFVLINFFINNTNKNLFYSFFIQSIFAVLAGGIIPYLKEGNFLFSYLMIAIYSLFLSYIIKVKTKGVISNLSYILLPALFIILLSISPKTEMYSHVYSLLIYKLRFLGIKPTNPELLPPEVRAFWVPPYLSPSIKEILSNFFTVIPLSLIGIIYVSGLLFKKKLTDTETTTLFLTLSYLFFYLLFTRMSTSLIFFLSLFWGYTFKFLQKKFVNFTLLILFGGSLIIEFYQTYSGVNSIFNQIIYGKKPETDSIKISYYYKNELLKKINTLTPKDSVILTRWALSSTISAYTKRKVILHSFFESPKIRKKNQEFIEALFKDEGELYNFCKKYKANYLVIPKNMLSDDLYSERYIAAVKEITPKMSLVKLLTDNKPVTHFKLIWENAHYRLFEVIN